MVEDVAVPFSGRSRRANVVEYCDGCGLALPKKRSGCLSWILGGTAMVKGADFVEAIKIRQNLIDTRERSNRGTNAPLNMHVLQECPVTARMRTARHDMLAEVLRSALLAPGPSR